MLQEFPSVLLFSNKIQQQKKRHTEMLPDTNYNLCEYSTPYGFPFSSLSLSLLFIVTHFISYTLIHLFSVVLSSLYDFNWHLIRPKIARLLLISL